MLRPDWRKRRAIKPDAHLPGAHVLLVRALLLVQARGRGVLCPQQCARCVPLAGH